MHDSPSPAFWLRSPGYCHSLLIFLFYALATGGFEFSGTRFAQASPNVSIEEKPGGIEIEDADPDTASTGLVFAIAGPVLIVGSGVLMAAGLQHACLMAECQNHDNSGSGLLVGGLVAFVAGAVMTPLGWVTWARNRHPRLHEDPTTIKVAVVPNRDGALLGLSGQF